MKKLLCLLLFAGLAHAEPQPNNRDHKDNNKVDVGPIKTCVLYNMCWKHKKVPPMCKVNPQGFLECYPIDLLPEEEELVI
jgi:hypothetical protein